MDNSAGRLERVERRQRILVVAWITSLVVMVALWAGVQRATSQDSVVRAREFDLVDTSGNIQAKLGLNANGRADLWFYDAAGKERVQVGFQQSAPGTNLGIWLDDAAGGARTELYLEGADSSNYPGGRLVFADANGKIRINLGKAAGSGPNGLFVFDATQGTSALFGQETADSAATTPPGILLYKGNDIRAQLRLDNDGNHPTAFFYDSAGRMRVRLGVIRGNNGDDVPGYLLANESGDVRMELEMFEGKPRLDLSDETGRIRDLMGFNKNDQPGLWVFGPVPNSGTPWWGGNPW